MIRSWAQDLQNARRNPVTIFYNLVVPKSQDAPAFFFKEGIAPIVIAGLGMLPAIGFDDEPGFGTCKIDDIWGDHELSSETPAQLLVAQQVPKRPLGIGRICYAIPSRARSVVRRPAYSVWDPAWLAPTLTLPRKRGRELHHAGGPRESAVAGDVIDGDGLAEALEGEVAHFFEADIALDRAGDPLRDQDLAVGRLVAEAGGEIAYRADRGVVDPLGKTDLAQGRVPLGDADAEPDLAPAPTPIDLQPRHRLAHLDRHLDRALSRIGHGNGSLKNTMIPSPAKWSSVPSERVTIGPSAS